jgi:8-oxo-dGTP pyrophosphatase MutT (NUDIX family)
LHAPIKNIGIIAAIAIRFIIMDFDLFSKSVPKIKNLPLPGENAHYKMTPAFRAQELEAFRFKARNPKKAGVMALFYPDDQQHTKLLLILRKTYKGVHSNQIAFPGGKAEKIDIDLLQTALRETQEEVGVDPGQIEVIRQMSTVYIPPSNFEVQPYLGLSRGATTFRLQKSEVEALVEVRLADFLDDANVFTQYLNTSYAKNVAVPAFHLNEQTVWGATAMMLSEIKDLLKQVL